MKYILVTGVSSGIGYDIVEYFLDLGFYVFGSVRKEEDKERLEKEFTSNFTCLLFDTTNLSQIEAAFEIVKNTIQNQPLTALVNNAGYAKGGPIALLSDEDFRSQMEVNLFGVRNVINTFLPLLGAAKDFPHKPGKIINISSISGIFNTPMNGAYCISKHALESMAEVYRRELLMYGIQVSSIQPGPIESKLWNKNIGSLQEYYHSDYGNMAKNSDKIMLNASRDALPARVISKLVHKIIQSRSPKTSYIVSKNRFLIKIITTWIPKKIIDLSLYYILNKKPK